MKHSINDHYGHCEYCCADTKGVLTLSDPYDIYYVDMCKKCLVEISKRGEYEEAESDYGCSECGDDNVQLYDMGVQFGTDIHLCEKCIAVLKKVAKTKSETC